MIIISELTEIICIQCPVACRIKLSISDAGAIEDITGYQCKEGKKYAPQEYKSPERVFSTTVRTEKSERPVLPVRSNGSVPRQMVTQCVRFLAHVKVQPPLSMGDCVVSNILDTGVDVICTDDLRT